MTSRAVALGGGHGLHRSLQALARTVDDITAVVSVADDGGSSGRLRRDLDVVPPGDLRMALGALSRRRDLDELVQYRFERGELAGHSLGNLVLVALQELEGGDVVGALDRLGALLDVRGRVRPCTTTPVTLHADTAAGAVSGQAAIARTRGVRRVWVEPADVAATPDALAAIGAADLVVLGPGSLYTSIIPNLLVPGVVEALRAASAPVVLVGNLREQRGETEGLGLGDHLAALRLHAPALEVDVLVAHEHPDGLSGQALAADDAGLATHVGRVMRVDVHDGHDGHDPAALGATFALLLDEARDTLVVHGPDH